MANGRSDSMKYMSLIWRSMFLLLMFGLPAQASDIYGTPQRNLDAACPAPIKLDPVKTMALTASIIFVTSIDGQSMDYLDTNLRSSELNSFMSKVTYLGNGAVDLAIAGGIALAGDKETGYKAAIAMIQADLAVFVLKAAIGKPRPGISQDGSYKPFSLQSGYDSMPSGHTASVFALAGVAASAYPKYRQVIYGGAVLVGVSRLYEKKHWVSDVLAGAAIGLLSANMAEGGGRFFNVDF
jgi:undecaprenyl-diphosphatase